MAKRRRTTVSVEAVPVLFSPKYGVEVYRERGGKLGYDKNLVTVMCKATSISQPSSSYFRVRVLFRSLRCNIQC